MLSATDLRCEYRENPIAVFTEHPRFSWIIVSDGTNITQEAYELEVAGDNGFANYVWRPGKVKSAESIHVKYVGEVLSPGTRYYYRVKITDNNGGESEWSETAFFETAVSPSSFEGCKFITAESEGDGAKSAGSMFRKSFALDGEIVSARLCAAAKGIYEISVNGQKPGDQVLTPGWTEYQSRIMFDTWDVTGMLIRGENVLGMSVGPGWYKGDMAGGVGKRNYYGKRTAVFAWLSVTYADGRVKTVRSDESWQCAPSPVVYSEIYHGEIYDARLELPGWDCPGFEGDLKNADVESADISMLCPHDGVPVRERIILKPISLFTTPEGHRVLDFGQNLSGWVRFKVKGAAGQRVVLRHAETLDAKGNFYTENLRAARQRIEYILKGGKEEIYSPHFTFQGFRYVSVDECPGEIDPEMFEAAAIYSDMRPAGSFESSRPLLNKLVENIRWGMRDNFVDIPTDCPQRDERLGWTGDAQIFVRAASYLMETAPFFRKWLRDLKEAQTPDGGIPHVVPNALRRPPEMEQAPHPQGNATGWADVAVIAPWTMYKYFADRDILTEQYGVMKAWVGYIRSCSRDGLIWDTGFHFGDWVALDAPAGSRFGATPNDLTATAYYSYSVSLLAKISAILGMEDEAVEYKALREDIANAFHEEFFTSTGRLAARTQTAHVLALFFGLTPEKYMDRTINTLAALIEEQGGHLTTGFLGTPYICHALAQNGRLDLAYSLLLKEDYPSWLYPVTMGATTVWEHWDSLKPDGTMWSPSMNSFNHYAYGSVADFIFSVVAGLDADESEPGFKRIILAPKPGEGITWAKAEYSSLYGKISIKWELAGGRMTISIELPHNTTALLTLPGAAAGRYSGVDFAKAEGGAKASLGSGRYEFSYTYEGRI